jgi:Spy/CpxP family protein refolding chaperone
MKARWLSRSLFVSLAVVSSVAVAACSRGQTTTDTEPAPETAAAGAEERAWGQHGPGHRLFRQIEALDLTEDQSASLRDIEENLADELAPHRQTLRQVAETLAQGVEAGTLDEAAAARNQSALTEAAAAARASMVTAMNDVHDVLDQDQREELVRTLEERRWQARGDERREGASRVAAQLGLTEQQKQTIHDEIRTQVEKVFPDRKAKREAWEAKMQALGEAFVSDDFDAADFDLGSGAEEGIAKFTGVAQTAIDLSGRVLDPAQRVLLASLLRSRVAKM